MGLLCTQGKGTISAACLKMSTDCAHGEAHKCCVDRASQVLHCCAAHKRELISVAHTGKFVSVAHTGEFVSVAHTGELISVAHTGEFISVAHTG